MFKMFSNMLVIFKEWMFGYSDIVHKLKNNDNGIGGFKY